MIYELKILDCRVLQISHNLCKVIKIADDHGKAAHFK